MLASSPMPMTSFSGELGQRRRQIFVLAGEVLMDEEESHGAACF
jgi:hypothetical protein